MGKIARLILFVAVALCCIGSNCLIGANDSKLASKSAKEKPKTLPFKKDEGREISIAGGNKIWLSVQDGNFVICYLNQKNELIEPITQSATITYNCRNKKQRLVKQLSSNGEYLKSGVPVQRPYIFSAVAVLLGEDLLPSFSYNQVNSSGEIREKQ